MKAFTLMIAAATSLGLAACHSHDHPHDHPHEATEQERFEWWGFTDVHEIFVDAAVPEAGVPHSLFIHLTDAAHFVPAADASVRLAIQSAQGEEQIKGERVQPGIWRVNWTAPTTGEVTFTLWWATASQQGQTPLGSLDFTADAVTWDGWNQPEAAVSFGRELVWSVPFATEEVRRDTVWSTLTLAGRWMPAPGEDRVLTAGATGTVRWSEGIAVAGAPVAKGQILARIEVAGQADRGLAAEAAAAEAEWGAAQAAVKRLEPLRDAGVVTAGEWDEAVARLTVAEEARQRLQGIRDGQAWEVRSPMDGFVRAIRAANGEFVGPQSALCLLTADQEQWVEVAFNPDWKEPLRTARGVQLATDAGWVQGHLASIANQIQPPSGLLSAYLVLDEVVPGAQPVAGSYVEVEAECGPGRPALVIPSTALLEQYGQYEVAVQLAGEQFELRPVIPGERNARWTEIKTGLEAGERVVTTGAYAVRMASLKGSTPAHGHSH